MNASEDRTLARTRVHLPPGTHPQFNPFPDSSVSQSHFGGDRVSLRGASLHTQRCLRRASFRNWASQGDRYRFTGLRLVFPPA